MREQAKTPESSFQRAYLRQKKREREQVRVQGCFMKDF